MRLWVPRGKDKPLPLLLRPLCELLAAELVWLGVEMISSLANSLGGWAQSGFSRSCGRFQNMCPCNSFPGIQYQPDYGPQHSQKPRGTDPMVGPARWHKPGEA